MTKLPPLFISVFLACSTPVQKPCMPFPPPEAPDDRCSEMKDQLGRSRILCDPEQTRQLHRYVDALYDYSYRAWKYCR